MRRCLVLISLSMCAMGQSALDEDLLAAARKGDLAQVQALLGKGAKLEAVSRYNQTPLFFAARNGHEDVVRFLLEKGANPKVSDSFYKMSLVAAAADKGNTGVVRMLLDAGAGDEGPVLAMAAGRGQMQMAEMVLARGKLKPEDLSSALQAAQQRKQSEMIALLEKAGAKPPPKPEAQVGEEILRRYEGTFRGEPVGELKFEVKAGKLFLGSQGQSLELGAFDETNFGLLANPAVKFRIIVEAGKATGVTLLQGSQELPLKRVEVQQ